MFLCIRVNVSPALNDVLNFICFLSFMGGFKYFSVLMKELDADFNGILYYGMSIRQGFSLQEDSQQTPLTLYKVDVAFPFKNLIKKLEFFL